MSPVMSRCFRKQIVVESIPLLKIVFFLFSACDDWLEFKKNIESQEECVKGKQREEDRGQNYKVVFGKSEELGVI